MVLRLRTEAPNWNDAKCLGTAPPPDNDIWFDNSDDGYPDLTDEGRDFCNGTEDDVVCPIRAECLRFALINNERSGVWGGMKDSDRRLMRKLFPWDPRNPAEANPEWRWRSTEELQALYKRRFGKTAPPEIEEEEDDDE